MLIQADPAQIDTDTVSVWTGAPAFEQEITHTLNNDNGATLTVFLVSSVQLDDDEFWIEVEEPDQVGGPIKVTAYLAKPSTIVYLDPKLQVNLTPSRQWFAEGVGMYEGVGGTVIINKPRRIM